MMKKLLLTSLLSVSCFTANADTVLGIYAGASYWDASTSGSFSSENSIQAHNFDDEGKNNYWLAIEHFIPLVPNLKLRHNELDTIGNNATVSEDSLISTNTSVDAGLDHTDIIMYYEIFDNDLISVDLGVNFKYADYVVDLQNVVTEEQDDGSEIITTTASEENYDGVIPMLYANVDLGIPGTDLNIYTDASFISFSGDSAYDVQAGLKYRLIENLAVDVDLQLGYRALQVDVEDLSGLYIDTKWDGAFAGIELHF